MAVDERAPSRGASTAPPSAGMSLDAAPRTASWPEQSAIDATVASHAANGEMTADSESDVPVDSLSEDTRSDVDLGDDIESGRPSSTGTPPTLAANGSAAKRS